LQKLVIYGDMHSAGMLSREDSLAFIAEYRTSVNERIRERWRNLIFRVFSIEDAVAMDALSDLARTDKPVAEDLATHTSCRVLPDEQNWMKQDYERQLGRNRTEHEAKPSL